MVAGYDTPRTDGMQGFLSGGRPELGNHICRGAPPGHLDLTGPGRRVLWTTPKPAPRSI